MHAQLCFIATQRSRIDAGCKKQGRGSNSRRSGLYAGRDHLTTKLGEPPPQAGSPNPSRRRFRLARGRQRVLGVDLGPLRAPQPFEFGQPRPRWPQPTPSRGWCTKCSSTKWSMTRWAWTNTRRSTMNSKWSTWRRRRPNSATNWYRHRGGEAYAPRSASGGIRRLLCI